MCDATAGPVDAQVLALSCRYRHRGNGGAGQPDAMRLPWVGDLCRCCAIVTAPAEPALGYSRRSGMTRHLGCKDAAVVAGCLLVISGCTGGAVRSAAHQDIAARSGPARLMSFHGCGDELAALRKAAEASVGPFGLPGVAGSAEGTAYPAGRAAGAPTAAGADAPASVAPAAAPAYSGTNDYQAGVDEPDLVKTDGRRIVTVAGGVLQVIDAASRTVTGRLDLDAVGAGIGYQPANLLL